jgi:long-subunit fatty acid transport protein
MLTFTNAQDKVHIHLDYNHLFGIYEESDFWSINGMKYSLSGFELGLTGMYSINKRLSTGLGVSAERLYSPDRTLFPVYGIVTYAPLNSYLNPYIFTKVGYGIGTKISNPGLIFSPGIGYKLKFREHFGLNFHLGYHLTQIKYDITYEDLIILDTRSIYRHSIALSLGLIF